MWRGTTAVVHARFDTAQAELSNSENTPETGAIVERAYNSQRRLLDTADIDSMRTSELAAHYLALVLLGIPRAARAQRISDTPGTARAQKERAVHTLSQFNYDLATALLYMSPQARGDIRNRLERLDRLLIAGTWHLDSLGKDLPRRITGAECEVAAFTALETALPKQWEVKRATRAEDQSGIDIIVTDDAGVDLLLDVKSRTAFQEAVDTFEARTSRSSGVAQTVRKEGALYQWRRGADGRQVLHCTFDATSFGTINNCLYDDPTVLANFVVDSMPERAAHQVGQTPRRSLGRTALR